jgi:N-acetyl-anhydromuramyl-L-alanine amidase AmpD
MREHRIGRITIHHTASRHAPHRTAADKVRGLQRFSQAESALGDGRIKKPWADVPYHFYVAVDGTVAEARPWRFVGDSNTPYDPTGHLLIGLEGNFEEETVTPAQQRSLERLVAVMARRFHVPPENVAAHKDFAETLCPGKALYALLPRLREVAAANSASTAR